MTQTTVSVSKQQLVQDYSALRPVFLKLSVVMNPKQKLTPFEKAIFLDQCQRCQAVISKLKPLLSQADSKEKAMLTQLVAVEGAMTSATQAFMSKPEAPSSSTEEDALLAQLTSAAFEESNDSTAKVVEELLATIERIKKVGASAINTTATKPPSPPLAPLDPLPPLPPLVKLLDDVIFQHRTSADDRNLKRVFLTPAHKKVGNTPANIAKLREMGIEFQEKGKLLVIPNQHRETMLLDAANCGELEKINRHLASQFAIRARVEQTAMKARAAAAESARAAGATVWKSIPTPIPAGADSWVEMYDGFDAAATQIFRSDEADLIKIEKLDKLLKDVKEMLIFSNEYPHFKIANAVELYLRVLQGQNSLKNRSF
jgi:hypothetical protein